MPGKMPAGKQLLHGTDTNGAFQGAARGLIASLRAIALPRSVTNPRRDESPHTRERTLPFEPSPSVSFRPEISDLPPNRMVFKCNNRDRIISTKGAKRAAEKGEREAASKTEAHKMAEAAYRELKTAAIEPAVRAISVLTSKQYQNLFSYFSRYETTLFRSRTKALEEFMRLQAARTGKKNRQRNHAVEVDVTKDALDLEITDQPETGKKSIARIHVVNKTPL